MKSTEFTAKTVEQAIEEGLKHFSVDRDRVEVDVLSEGGFLSKAKIIMTVKDSQGEIAQNFLENVLKLMKVSAYIELEEAENESVLNIIGSDVSALLGRSGETIDSMQYLASLVANANNDEYRRIVLDSDDYRSQRTKRLENIADKMAAKAIKQGFRVKLDPMNPYERRVMHARLQLNDDVTTHSEGTDPLRYLVITPKKQKFDSFSPSSKFGGNYSNRNRDNKRPSPPPDRNRGYRGGQGYSKPESQPRPTNLSTGSLITNKPDSEE